MKKNSEKKKVQWQQYIAMVFFILVGGVCGVLMGQYLEQRAETGASIAEEILSLVLGLKYKKTNVAFDKNILSGFIAGIILLLFGCFCFFLLINEYIFLCKMKEKAHGTYQKY